MAEDKIMGLKAAITGVLATLTAFWGWFGWMIVAWCLLMLTDFVVGMAVASKGGHWSSQKLREGAWHKGGMVLTVGIALTVDWLIATTISHIPMISLPFDYTVLLAPLVVVWYIVGELGSLAEHAVTMGAPVPEWLVRILEAGRKAVDAAGDAAAGEEKEEEK